MTVSESVLIFYKGGCCHFNATSQTANLPTLLREEKYNHCEFSCSLWAGTSGKSSVKYTQTA